MWSVDSMVLTFLESFLNPKTDRFSKNLRISVFQIGGWVYHRKPNSKVCKLLRTNLPIISKGLSWNRLYLRYIKGFLCKHTPRTWDGNIFPAAVGKHLMFLQQWLPAWTPGTYKISVKCVDLSLQQYFCQKCSSKQSCLLEVPGMFKSILDLLRANLVVLERRWSSCELVRKRDVQVGCEGWNSKKFQCPRNYRIRKDWAAASKSSSVRMSRRWIQTQTSFFAECIGRPWSDSSHRNLASNFDPLWELQLQCPLNSMINDEFLRCKLLQEL